MRDHQRAHVVFAGRIHHATRAVAQRVDVETGVELVEDRDLRLQDRHLQRLVALLLATRQIDIERTIEELLVEIDAGRLGAQGAVEPRDVGVASAPLERFPEHGIEHHSRHFRGVLHDEVQTSRRALPRGESQHVDPVEQHLAAGHGVTGLTHDDRRQSALARTIRPHDRMHFTRRDREIDTIEDLFAGHRGRETTNLESAHDATSTFTLPSTTEAAYTGTGCVAGRVSGTPVTRLKALE